MTPALTVSGLFKSYGAIPVLKDVAFSVADGETLAIIGPNGAGKTTMFKSLTGEVPVDAGRIEAFGVDVTAMPAERRVAGGFGRTFQVARVFAETTLLENLVLAVESRRRMAGERVGGLRSHRPAPETVADAERWLAATDLLDKRDLEARFLSHGDKKRLEMALVLALHPKVLMLDEPTAGMSHSDRVVAVDLIRRIRADHGVTVLLTEHDMDTVFGLSDRIMVLNYGEVIAVGTGEEIRANPVVREVYLGQEGAHA